MDQTAETVLRLDGTKGAGRKASKGLKAMPSAFLALPSRSVMPSHSKTSPRPSPDSTVDMGMGLSCNPADWNDLLNDSLCTRMPVLDLLQEDGFSAFPPEDLEYFGSQLQTDGCTLNFIQPMALPTYLPSAALEKQMMYSTFIDTYLPRRMGHTGDAHFSFLQHLITTPQLRPEVDNALDALSMVQVGSFYKDQTLIRGSIKAYSASLNGLIRSLSTSASSGNDSVTDDYVLATVNILATCEFYDEISQMGTGWSHHIDGSRQLLEARGPDSVQSYLSLMLFSNMKHGALCHGYLTRKGTFLGRKEWRAVAERVPFYEKDSSSKFYDLALQVPALLEREDQLDEKGDRVTAGELDQLLLDVRNIETGLKTWWQDFKSSLGNLQPYWLVSIDEFEAFKNLVKDEAKVVDKAWMFPNFMFAYLISCYWDTMHFLRTCVKNIHLRRYEISAKSHEEARQWFPPAEEIVTEDELLEYVMNMVRCFPYFTEPSSSATGSIGIFLPLRTAALYCAQHGHWALLKWLGEVRDCVFVKGMRPPFVKQRQPKASQKLFVVTRPPGSALVEAEREKALLTQNLGSENSSLKNQNTRH
ncbi:hypothetical protein AC579_7703 [Pseudocercospora musae]|uniref:Transcription factor domain-containing protein n=1 Tax=Pseudocercospora musae TaxID=113226 RepID=A0A139IU71_9PEZI|nr:hypothetical protein AC579_7703 [Pseudocercospora musae]